MIAVKPAANPKTKLTRCEKEKRVCEVASNVTTHLNALKKRFASRFAVLQFFACKDSCQELVCTLCEGTGFLGEGLSDLCPLCMPGV